MASSFHQKLDNVKESLASLFKNRRRRRSLNGVGEGNVISGPQNVKRVMHITFNAGQKSFEGIPEHWSQYFHTMSANSAPQTLVASSAAMQDEYVVADDSGVSMVTEKAETAMALTFDAPLPQPKEVLSLTYDRESGAFVDLPPHWRERLERNNLLAPEFQKNPDLLTSVFALMDEELRAMSREGISLDRELYTSSPVSDAAARGDGGSQVPLDLQYVYQIEADRSNASSMLEEPLLPPSPERRSALGLVGREELDPACLDQVCLNGQQQLRRTSLVRVTAVPAPPSLSANYSYARMN